MKERLALLECGVQRVAAPKARPGAHPEKPTRRAMTYLGTSFWVGLGCGSALGSAVLLFGFLTHPDEMRTPLHPVQAAADAMAPPSISTSREVQTYAPAGTPTQAAFAMRIHRDDGGAASLGLRVVGVDSPDGVQVLLRDVPATAKLSRGERRDQGTWALRVAELENLQLTLGDGTPDTFDITIEVATAGGMRMASAVAHVRVSEPPSVAAMPAPPARVVAAGSDGVRQPAVPASGSAVVEKPFRTEVTAAARADQAPPEQRSARPPLPQGISALGGPTGSPEAETLQPSESRTVWWKLPPAWMPFKDGAGSH